MNVADFVAAHKGRIVAKWQELAVERLALDLEKSELLNDLPGFLDDMEMALRDGSWRWTALDSARSHGESRMRCGIDIGALTEEMGLVAESVCVVANDAGQNLSTQEVLALSRVLGRGTAASVTAYARLRDQELARQAGEHFSFIAHEIRTPLQTARLAADVLSGAPQIGESPAMRRLEDSLVKVSELVDNALINVRLSDQPVVHIARVSAVEIAKAACDEVAVKAEAKGISISTEIDEIEIDADPKLLVSAITNLVGNAIKFTPDGGSISFRVACVDDRVLFEVADECGGMPEDLPGKLFQPYVQESSDKTGFGLGLTIVKQAIEAHEGSVRVNNRPPHGCTFVLDMPARQPQGPRGSV